MPLYEYYCPNCAKNFELLRPMKDCDSPASCPSCSSTQTRKLLPRVNASSEGKSLSGSSCQSCSGGNCSCCGH